MSTLAFVWKVTRFSGRIYTLDVVLAMFGFVIIVILPGIALQQAALWGESEGGPSALLFAATQPQRTTALVLGCSCFGLAWCITIAAAHAGGSASRTAVFALAMAVLAAGETLLSPALSPIVNDLAPDALRGRYNGVFVLAYTTGFAVGPLLAGQSLRLGDGTPFFVILAGACGVAAVGAALLRRLLDPRLDRVGTAPVETPLLGAEVG